MSEELNPYDGGYRLEPKPWAPLEGDDFGRVDFDNDEGSTLFTAWFQKNEDGGYLLRIDEQQDVELTIETSQERAAREATMTAFDAELRQLAAQHPLLFTLSDSDPETFGAGHYVLENHEHTLRLTITEEYDGTDWSDEDQIPNRWNFRTEEMSSDGSESRAWHVTGDEHDSELPGMITKLEDWVKACSEHVRMFHEGYGAFAAQVPLQTVRESSSAFQAGYLQAHNNTRSNYGQRPADRLPPAPPATGPTY